jgi:ferredoxin
VLKCCIVFNIEEIDMNNLMKASVNKNACIGCGICIDICPAVFEFDPQGLSEASTFITPELDHNARAAAHACPTCAITIY